MSLSDAAVAILGVSDVHAAPLGTTVVYVHRLSDEIAAALPVLPLEEIKGDGSPRITDQGLAHLARIHTLEFLDLEWASDITDSGLRHLHEIQGLRWVDLGGCAQVTAAGIAALERALARCVVLTLTDREASPEQERRRELRKISHRCPACTARLLRTAAGTRKKRQCQVCGSTHRPNRECTSCSTNRVWSGPLGDFCKGCGAELTAPSAGR